MKHLDKIRKRKKEERRRKKEEERRQEEEKRRAQEAKAREQLAKNPVSDENDGYSRVYGEYGWKWIKTNKTGNENNAQQQGAVNGEAVSRPGARRSLDNDFRSSQPADSILRGTGPVSFISKKSVDASPLSDVTCSQSPSKSAAAATRRPVTFAQPETIQENKEVEDPIMALMMQIEAQKKSKARAATSPAAPSPDKEKDQARKEDPMEIQMRLSLEKSQKQDPMDIIRQKEQERARQMEGSESESEHSSPKAEARNPLTLQRMEDRRSFSPQGDGTAHVAQAPAADLWDDDSEEEEREEEEAKFVSRNKNKKKPAARKKTDGKKSDGKKTDSQTAKAAPAKRKKATAKPASRPQPFDDDSDSDSDSPSSNEQEDSLIPTFDNPKLGPPSALEPLVLPHKDETVTHEIPASINRYLRGYQQHGVMFLYSCIMRNSGAILGDDMGLGKTVQIISLLASLMKKTGTGKDALELHRRRRLITQKLREIKGANDEALMLTGTAPTESLDPSEIEGLSQPEWAPVLVIVPPTVIDNWVNEFRTWGHFSVSLYQGSQREHALKKVQNGISEVLVSGSSLALTHASELSVVKWKLMIVDEVHLYKNDASKRYQALRELRESSECPMIGLTGTVMPNRHEELFNLVDLVAPGHFGDKKSFKIQFSEPIKYARMKSAQADVIQKGNSSHQILDAKLKQVYIHRTKEQELGDELPEKNETILFCPPTDIQKELYQHLLTLPDYELLRYANAPCDCGINQGIFMGYRRLRTQKEKINYQRMHRNDIKRRKECCYVTPVNPAKDDEGEPWAHPDAAIWRFQHKEDEACENCPYCIMFPACAKLYRLSSHAALLMASADPDSFPPGSENWKNAAKEVAFAKVAIPPHILAELPGSAKNPYVRQAGVMDDHAKLSGKMDKLDTLLRVFDRGSNRVLLFSHFTTTLDLIQQFVSSRGYSYVRLDGNTSTPERQKLCDRFQSDDTIFLFLISTKAGGLGLNLTAANKVIQFDLDFNPSHDEQAQDRAYRVGQSSNVQVVRLIAEGTIEEQKYIRQIYKTHLKNDTLKDQENGRSRIFRGVEGDKARKGEVFGIENLLKFKPDGSFMNELYHKKPSGGRASRGDQTVNTKELAKALTSLTEEDVEHIGGNALDEDFDYAATAHTEGVDFESKRSATGKPSGEDDNEEDVDIVEAAGVANALNHQDVIRTDEIQEDSDDDVEVLGGASQNIMAVFDRDRSDNDESEEDDDAGAGANQPPLPVGFPLGHGPPAPIWQPLPPVQELSPPRQVPQPIRQPSPQAHDSLQGEETRGENVLPQKRSIDEAQLVAALGDINDDTDNGSPDEAEVEVEFLETPVRESKKPKTSKKAQLKKSTGKEKTKTSFSSLDISIPQYSKKKKKKTKK